MKIQKKKIFFFDGGVGGSVQMGVGLGGGCQDGWER